MKQAARRLTFEEYLALEDKSDLPEERCEFVDGELVELPPSELNDFIARYLLFVLASSGIVSLRLITIHTPLIGTFCTSERIYSPKFGDLQLTAQQIFTAGSLG